VLVADLSRLAEGLVSSEGSVRFQLRGKMESGRPTLELSIDTVLILPCQYCQEPYLQELHVARVLPLARDEAELARWEQGDPLLDALVADPMLDVLMLVEDEILLSLPVVPRHPGEICGSAGDQVIVRS
jgi:uncharacterized protein